MINLGKSRTRALALSVGAVAVGSLGTFLALNGAEARLGLALNGAEARLESAIAMKPVAAATMPDCDPVCSSLVVASPSPGG
ncbi:MAG TPA: hypothetical protein VMP03_09640, partial [Methylomirabilota bacterium]|nr:hypothetical protein [Methylomirabilota bacterium]